MIGIDFDRTTKDPEKLTDAVALMLGFLTGMGLRLKESDPAAGKSCLKMAELITRGLMPIKRKKKTP